MRVIYKKIFKYSKQSKFVRTILIYMARQMNERDVMSLQHAFNRINISTDAEMTMEEFVKGTSTYP